MTNSYGANCLRITKLHIRNSGDNGKSLWNIVFQSYSRTLASIFKSHMFLCPAFVFSHYIENIWYILKDENSLGKDSTKSNRNMPGNDPNQQCKNHLILFLFLFLYFRIYFQQSSHLCSCRKLLFYQMVRYLNVNSQIAKILRLMQNIFCGPFRNNVALTYNFSGQIVITEITVKRC